MRRRYWLWWRLDDFRVKAETTRALYNQAHAEVFPNEHGPDFDPPDDDDWWTTQSITKAICGFNPDGKWSVLLPAVWRSRGGYFEDVAA